MSLYKKIDLQEQIYRPKDLDTIRFFGDFEFRQIIYFGENSNMVGIDITEFDLQEEILKKVRSLMFSSVKPYNVSNQMRTYSSVLHDDKVKVFWYGRTIRDIITERILDLGNKTIFDYDFNIRARMVHQFPDYKDSSFRVGEIKDISQYDHKDIVNDYLHRLSWRNNIKKLCDFTRYINDDDLYRKMDKYRRSEKIRKILC